MAPELKITSAFARGAHLAIPPGLHTADTTAPPRASSHDGVAPWRRAEDD
jgi:hypothetical protein